MKLKVGDKAPLFEGVKDDGERLGLSELIGRTNIILYFYPKDMTMGCTREACGYRDNWEKIVSMGGTVVGVSSQGIDSHKKFKEINSLPFTLVSDPNSEIRKLYGATGMLIPPRVTFVIDREGVIRYILSSQLSITKHISDALETLDSIRTVSSA
jgi:thioredoxin-dependent peroxiredoxin